MHVKRDRNGWASFGIALLRGRLGRAGHAHVAQVTQHGLVFGAQTAHELRAIQTLLAGCVGHVLQNAQAPRDGLFAIRRQLPPLGQNVVADVLSLLGGHLLPDSSVLADLILLLRAEPVPLLQARPDLLLLFRGHALEALVIPQEALLRLGRHALQPIQEAWRNIVAGSSARPTPITCLPLPTRPQGGPGTISSLPVPRVLGPGQRPVGSRLLALRLPLLPPGLPARLAPRHGARLTRGRPLRRHGCGSRQEEGQEPAGNLELGSHVTSSSSAPAAPEANPAEARNSRAHRNPRAPGGL